MDGGLCSVLSEGGVFVWLACGVKKEGTGSEVDTRNRK